MHANPKETKSLALREPYHIAPTMPFRSEWAIDTAVNAPGWTMAYVQTEGNQRSLVGNRLAEYARDRRGTQGEAGILDQIFNLVGTDNQWCCEFGASDGTLECNTYDLVRSNGWSAVYIEPGAAKYSRLAEEYHDWPNVYTFDCFVRFDPPGTIDAILGRTPCPKNLDLMVIDIDGCDYHIWQSISEYRARVVMIEFNSTISHDVCFVQPRDMAVHQGSSLLAMTELAKSRGYELVATTTWNAFFVDRSLYERFDITDNHPTVMHRPPTAMNLFQLYDGTLVLGGWAHLHWLLVRLALEDIQVLPKGLRRFSRRLARASLALMPNGGTAPGTSWRGQPRVAPGNQFGAFARDVASFYGDDGIIEALVSRLDCRTRAFLDIACFGSREGSRVWHLSTAEGWEGYIVRVPSPSGAWDCAEDFATDRVTYIELDSITFTGRLDFRQAIIGALRKEIDFLSIGVDGADYQIWQSLSELRPILVAITFNPTIPNDIFFVQAPDFTVNQGCSLNALIELGRQLGYELSACSLATAFFVRKDHFHLLGLSRNDVDSMHTSVYGMRIFQLYDGTLRLAGARRLLWHNIELAEDEIQVLPRALRHWPATVPDGPHAGLYVKVN